jgi:hypothetical protein
LELKILREEEEPQSEEPLSWHQALAENPDYYMNNKQGQKELAEMIRRESEKLLEEIGKSVKRTKEVIWLSKYCSSCKFFAKEGSRLSCKRWSVRIVKPFYGRPVWEAVPAPGTDREKEMVVSDIDWNKKWKEISDQIVEWAVEKVNGGYPYFCYTRG